MGVPKYFIGFLVLLFAFSVQADLLLSPSRLVLEGDQRSGELDIANTGPETVIYRFHLVNLRMSETGQVEMVKEPAAGELFADNFIYFSPRQMTLLPYSAKVIRIGVRKPKDLAVGEYRSHLLIERIPEYTDIVSSSKKGIQIQVKALVSATLPLIVRHGEMVAQVKINDFLFKPAVVGTPAALRFALRRNGNSSVYGDLTFDFVSPAGETRHIGRREGIAIYFPNTHRLMHMDLPDLKPGKGKLVVSYWLPESTQDSKPLAQAEYIFSE